ncbi:MAG: helix-turn-helix transcriptional regulator [Opitutaceae bacterium]|nr:helix-turn-helix transcriptional regulator [Opitutaceae bacterium]
MVDLSPYDNEARLSLAEWASLQTSLVWAHQGPVEPQWRQGRIHSPHLTAWLVRRGSVSVQMGSERWKAGVGDWFFPPEGDRWQEFSDDADIISIRYKASWPTGESLFKEGLGVVVPEADIPELTGIAAELVAFTTTNLTNYPSWDVMQCTATLAENLRLQALFSRWLEAVVKILISRGTAPSRIEHMDTRVLKIVRHLNLRAWSGPVKESVLAEKAGLSVSQLNRLFIRHMGISTHGYLDRQRYQNALAALTESSHSIKEIAYKLGFSSLQHFSTWFNRRHGSPPRLLRTEAATKSLKPSPAPTATARASGKTTRAPRPAPRVRRRSRPSA